MKQPTYHEFLAMNPELTAHGFVTVDDPRYPELRQRLVNSRDEWSTCLLWLARNEIPRHVETTAELKHYVERDSWNHIPQGACIVAVMMLDIPHKRHREGLTLT